MVCLSHGRYCDVEREREKDTENHMNYAAVEYDAILILVQKHDQFSPRSSHEFV